MNRNSWSRQSQREAQRPTVHRSVTVQVKKYERHMLSQSNICGLIHTESANSSTFGWIICNSQMTVERPPKIWILGNNEVNVADITSIRFYVCRNPRTMNVCFKCVKCKVPFGTSPQLEFKIYYVLWTLDTVHNWQLSESNIIMHLSPHGHSEPLDWPHSLERASWRTRYTTTVVALTAVFTVIL